MQKRRNYNFSETKFVQVQVALGLFCLVSLDYFIYFWVCSREQPSSSSEEDNSKTMMMAINRLSMPSSSCSIGMISFWTPLALSSVYFCISFPHMVITMVG